MVIRPKKQKQCQSGEAEQGDCWIALSVAYNSGLIVSARVGKHTDALLNELLVSNQGKTDCTVWKTDEWGGYERILPEEVEHWLGKAGTQRIERTNGIIRQQTGRWHRRQNKFGKVWEQTKVGSASKQCGV